MLEFQLFRLKVYPAKQSSLFGPEQTRAQILRAALLALPSAELRRGNVWHVGNVETLDGDGIYFRVGRTSRSSLALYKDGVFLDTEFETAPYTHVILDIALEVCAIAKKSQLSPTTKGIASRFSRLLNEAGHSGEVRAAFEIDEISDPEDFITYIRQAYSILKFWITVSRPNPFDENEDFVKPFQRFLTEADAYKGKAEVDGANLKADILEELTRSAASAGNDAGATLISKTEERKVRKRLRGNTVNVPQEDVSDEQSKRDVLRRTRESYNRIRKKTGSRE
jgi:hypothetical protein